MGSDRTSPIVLILILVFPLSAVSPSSVRVSANENHYGIHVEGSPSLFARNEKFAGTLEVNLSARAGDDPKTMLLTVKVGKGLSMASAGIASVNVALQLPPDLTVRDASVAPLSFGSGSYLEQVFVVRIENRGDYRILAHANSTTTDGEFIGSATAYVRSGDTLEFTHTPPPSLVETAYVIGQSTFDLASNVTASPGYIDVSGCFKYVDEQESNAVYGISYAKVELYDYLWPTDWKIGDGYTDSNGCFWFPNIQNKNGVGGKRSVWVKIIANTAAGKVTDGNVLGTEYWGRTTTRNNVPDGLVDLGTWYACTSSNAYCSSTVDVKNWAWNLLWVERNRGYSWVDSRPNTDGPPFLEINWSSGNEYPCLTCYTGSKILVSGSTSNPHHRYDGILAHEYGHFIAGTTWPTKPYSFDNSPGGGHDWCQTGYSTKLTWSEGWAHFFSATVRGTLTIDGVISGVYTVQNVETGVVTGLMNCNANSYGESNEVANAGTLQDIVDNAQDDQNSDGIGDELSIGVDNLWEILRTTSSIYTMNDLWAQLINRYSRSNTWATCYEHGMNKDNSAPSNPTGWSGSHSLQVWSSDNTIEVTWSGSNDDLSGVYGYSFIWDGSSSTIPDQTVDTKGTLSISQPLSSGTNWYLHVRTRDRAGNWNSGALHVGPFYVDTTPPNTPTLSESHCGASWTSHNSPYFTWNDPGDYGSGISYYEASMDGGAPFTIPNGYHPTWNDGIHRFKIRAVDGAGNRGSSWSNEITVKIDTTPPVGSIWINSGGTYTTSNSVTLILSAVDGGGSGAAYMRFSNDGSSWSSWEYYGTSKSWTLAPGDGTKTVYVKYRDYVGYESPLASDTIVLDTSPPSTISLSSPPTGTVTTNSKPTFSWNAATDATSGIASYTFQIDTSTTFNSGNLRTLPGIGTTTCTPDTPLSGGTWYWHVKALDNAGNPGSYSIYWSITLTAPDFQIWIDPSSRAISVGSSTSYTVYVKSTNGFSGTVSLDRSTNPTEPTITLTLDPSVALEADQTKPLILLVSTVGSTPDKSYAIAVMGTASGALSHSASTLLVVQPKQPVVHIESHEDNGATQNQGGIWVYQTSQCSGIPGWVIYPPMDPQIPTGSHCIRFFYDPGYYFVRWDTGGGISVGTPTPGDAFGSAVMTVTSDGSLTLVYSHPQSTMTVSYSILAGGAPTAPVFNYMQGGNPKTYVLTTTPAEVKADPGSSWSVTPNPLTGSTSKERWYSNQTLSGTASETSLVFTFYHQYPLTMQVNFSSGGITSPATGSSWRNSNSSVAISTTANLGYAFMSWSGSGSGSYTGPNNPSNVTMNGPITETANFAGQVTMTLSYSVAGGGGPAAPVFSYVHGGSSQNFTLATTPTSISVDGGSAWSVSPNPLSGSTSLERWWASQPTAGSATTQTTVFVYRHQYNLTMWAEPPDTGTLTPDSHWQDAGTAVTIATTPSEGYGFVSWNGSGYNGRDNPATITMNGAISETANLQPLLNIPLSVGWNLVSLPLVPKDPAIAAVLHYQIARNEVAIVWSYTGTPRAWKFFIPGKSSTLMTMVDGDAYWIYMRGADTLYADGYVIAPTKTPPTYALVAGWNLVGFKPQPTVTNETVAAYLSSIGGTYDVNSVWLYDNSNGTWIQATDSTTLHPGDAMWIRVTVPATLYPE